MNKEIKGNIDSFFERDEKFDLKSFRNEILAIKRAVIGTKDYNEDELRELAFRGYVCYRLNALDESKKFGNTDGLKFVGGYDHKDLKYILVDKDGKRSHVPSKNIDVLVNFENKPAACRDLQSMTKCFMLDMDSALMDGGVGRERFVFEMVELVPTKELLRKVPISSMFMARKAIEKLERTNEFISDFKFRGWLTNGKYGFRKSDSPSVVEVIEGGERFVAAEFGFYLTDSENFEVAVRLQFEDKSIVVPYYVVFNICHRATNVLKSMYDEQLMSVPAYFPQKAAELQWKPTEPVKLDEGSSEQELNKVNQSRKKYGSSFGSW